jgi:hypothetical protein
MTRSPAAYIVMGADMSKLAHRTASYIDAVAATQSISLGVLAFCLLSIAVYLVTGFAAIYPLLAILIGVAAATFWSMAWIIKRSQNVRL